MSAVFLADSHLWLAGRPDAQIEAIVTDPQYGEREYEAEQLEKASRDGGVWRRAPVIDGKRRSPVPRFTAMTAGGMENIADQWCAWGAIVARKLAPGGHAIVAANAMLAPLVFACIASGGLEFRGQITRITSTLRGGDRPKGAQGEFPDVCTLPRAAYEPWGIFRRPLLKGCTVAEHLRRFGTGGLRCRPGEEFRDVIRCGPATPAERDIAPHPTLKPQKLMRQIVFAALPTGRGVVVDPFAGSGSTLAAAEWCGYESIGVDRSAEYVSMAVAAVPRLAALKIDDE